VPHAKFGAFVRHVTKIPLSHPTIIRVALNVGCRIGRWMGFAQFINTLSRCLPAAQYQ